MMIHRKHSTRSHELCPLSSTHHLHLLSLASFFIYCYAAADKKQYPDRQLFKLKSTLKALHNGSLKEQGVTSGAELAFKDLGVLE